MVGTADASNADAGSAYACPAGWTQAAMGEVHCYAYNDNPATASEASAACREADVSGLTTHLLVLTC